MSPMSDTSKRPAPVFEDERPNVAPRRPPSLITYPFPLREGGWADITLSLPRDLTKAEADRLAGFIRSLAVDAVKPTTRAAEIVREDGP